MISVLIWVESVAGLERRSWETSGQALPDIYSGRRQETWKFDRSILRPLTSHSLGYSTGFCSATACEMHEGNPKHALAQGESSINTGAKASC